ncbi:hypothetical protein P7C71_g2820, partial [Lecanoromycetidae sp. Uapishka_2]
MTGFTFGNLMKQYLTLPETKAKYEQDIIGSLAKIEANPEKSKHLETITTKILGLDIDLVNLRKETYAEDSRTPTMEFGTPEEDALRRDATVNALFYNLNTSEVEDFTGRGLHDMEAKLIKTPLGPLQTFEDDPLRVLRSIRFASRLEYAIAEDDQIAMRNPSIKNALKLKISRERVGVEITKMLQGSNPYDALYFIDHLEIMAMKKAIVGEELPWTKELEANMRVAQGQAIRSWGSRWRSSVMYAILVEISEAVSVQEQNIFADYASWLSKIRDLNLLDVDKEKPIVNGKQLLDALGKPKAGPWMKKATDIAMEWQLRNPEETCPEGGIAEVMKRKEELGLH